MTNVGPETFMDNSDQTTALSGPEVVTGAVEGVCRLAHAGDRPHFVRMWRAYLEEEHKNGSDLLPDDHNLRVCRELFDAYTVGSLFGTVVFWSPHEGAQPDGVVMGGEDWGTGKWHTTHGKLAVLWGVYVDPAHRGNRIGLQMESFGRSHLKAQGFSHAVTMVRMANPLGKANWRHWDESFGVQALETRILASLEDS